MNIRTYLFLELDSDGLILVTAHRYQSGSSAYLARSFNEKYSSSYVEKFISVIITEFMYYYFYLVNSDLYKVI